MAEGCGCGGACGCGDLPAGVTLTTLGPHGLVPGGRIGAVPHVLTRRSWRPPDVRALCDPWTLPFGTEIPDPLAVARRRRRRTLRRGRGPPPPARGPRTPTGRAGSGAGGADAVLEGGGGFSGDVGGGPTAWGVYDTKPTTSGSGDPAAGGDVSGDTGGDTAQTEAHNDFVQGLGEAVAAGGNTAWQYATGYLGEGWYEEWQASLGDPRGPCTSWTMPDPSGWGTCAPPDDEAEALYALWGSPACGWCPDLSAGAVAAALPSLHLRIVPDLPWWTELFHDPLGPGGVIDGAWWFDPFPDGDSEERELIEKAWAVLVQNKDAILWAANYVEGVSLYLDLLYELLEAPGYADVVLTSDHFPCRAIACTFVDPSTPSDAATVVDELLDAISPGLGALWDTWIGQPIPLFPERRATIHLIRGATWDRYLQAYRENELCGAISLAGTLLHEMWHVVRDWHWADSLFSGYCYPPYILENLFRQAMYGRCTDAGESPCCVYELEQRLHLPFESSSALPCTPEVEMMRSLAFVLLLVTSDAGATKCATGGVSEILVARGAVPAPFAPVGRIGSENASHVYASVFGSDAFLFASKEGP